MKAISNRFFRNDIAFSRYDALAIGICAALSIFSINIPYPVVGSFIITCVTAPTSLPFWMMGEPLRSVVNKGQQISRKNIFELLHFFFSRNGKSLSFFIDRGIFVLTHRVIWKEFYLFGCTARRNVSFNALNLFLGIVNR